MTTYWYNKFMNRPNGASQKHSNDAIYGGNLIYLLHLVKCAKDSVNEFHHAAQSMRNIMEEN